MKKTLTATEQKVLTAFAKFKTTPTVQVLADKIKVDRETVRRALWSLVSKRYLKHDKKATTRKFFI